MADRAENYSDGWGGTVASQHDGEGSGRWDVRGGNLYLSEAGGVMEEVDIEVKYNSNGAPIIVADGTEYCQCE